MSARTRSWEQAERLARAERDLRDPVQIELRRIKEQEAAKIAAEKAQNITLAAACDWWIAGQKFKSNKIATIYRRAAWRIKAWAQDQGIENLRDVTPDLLDEWRGLWATDAERKYDRIGQSSQSEFLGYAPRNTNSLAAQ
jgi:hypothetical protein